MFAHIGNGIPGRTKCHSMISSTDWWITIQCDVVFLTEINKIIFMPIWMKFNLKWKYDIEENISCCEYTWLTLGILEFKLKMSNKWITSKLLTPMARA
jgi:hypothetical protein